MRGTQGHLPTYEVSHPGAVGATIRQPGSVSISNAERVTYHVHGTKRFSDLVSFCIPI